jgi:hypothetical protein
MDRLYRWIVGRVFTGVDAYFNNDHRALVVANALRLSRFCATSREM